MRRFEIRVFFYKAAVQNRNTDENTYQNECPQREMKASLIKARQMGLLEAGGGERYEGTDIASRKVKM